MPRLKGIGMPSKRKRKTAKLQEVPEPDADEVDQGSACGPASPTHSSPPTVDSDEDLMPLERELATAEHDLALARAARWMRMADAKLKVAKRIYEAKMRRLDATADTGSVERLSRRLMTEFEWKGHQLIHSKSEKIALAKKAEAKDYKLRFLERENARDCVASCCTPTYEACGTSVQASGQFWALGLILSAFESLKWVSFGLFEAPCDILLPISGASRIPERRGDRLEPVPSTPQTQAPPLRRHRQH